MEEFSERDPFRQEYRVGCHFLLQGISLTQGSNLRLLCVLHWQVDSTTSAAREAPLGTAPVLYSLGPLRKAGPAVSISQISSSLRGTGTDAGKCSPLIPVYSLNIYGAPIVCEALGIKKRAKTPMTLKAVTVEQQRQT